MLLTDGFCILYGLSAEDVFQAFLITNNLAFIALVNHKVVEQLVGMYFDCRSIFVSKFAYIIPHISFPLIA